MLLVQASALSAGYADRVLWENVSFSIESGDRIGFVGANGAGKTTLFRILTGELEPLSGTVAKASFVKVSCVEQHACVASSLSVLGEMMTVFAELEEREKELEALGPMIDAAGPEERDELIERQNRLHERFIDDGGLTFRARARSALLGLGFTEDELSRPVASLSGGQRTKLALAKLLNSGAELILLDEPTNHLDIMSVEWLEDFLSKFPGAFLVISHDRYFLDRVTNKTMELYAGRFNMTKGSYSAYAKLREQRELSESREREKAQKEIKRINAMIEQQKSFNRERNYITIASKQKQIERIRAGMPDDAGVEKEIHFTFEAANRSGDEVIVADGLAKSFGDNKLFENVGLRIERCQRAVLIGPNGCGKTTLLRILSRRLPPDAGFSRYGAGVVPGYFDQNGEGLFGDETVVDEIQGRFPAYSVPQLRSLLARFLFRGDEIEKKMSELSGGERARVALLLLMLRKPNLLFLDEPTNHLDIESREVLEKALENYDGTVVAVSHDRYFVNRIATDIYLFTDGGVRHFDGNYDDCVRAMREAGEEKRPEATGAGEDYRRKKEELRRER